MNTKHGSLLLALGLLASSCAPTGEIVIRQEVGPTPRRTAALKSDEGTLVVYSSLDFAPMPTDIDPALAGHTPYDIETLDGTLLKHVRNYDGGVFSEPDSVVLPPGHYRVSATAQEYGKVVVPVEIVARETTTVHLDSNDFASARQNASSAFVRLPDGQIVGWLEGKPAIPAEKR